MNGATQVINLAAGFLAPEFRGRRVRSFTDLVELLDRLFSLLRQAAGSAVLAILSDLESRLDHLRKHLGARALAIAAVTAELADPTFAAPHVTAYGRPHEDAAKFGHFDFMYTDSEQARLATLLDPMPVEAIAGRAFADPTKNLNLLEVTHV